MYKDPQPLSLHGFCTCFTRCSCCHFSVLWLSIDTLNVAKLPPKAINCSGNAEVQSHCYTTSTHSNKNYLVVEVDCGEIREGTEQWWLNLFDGILLEREQKKNLRIKSAVFMSEVDELRPFLQPGRSPKGLDVLSVEEQLAMTLYFLGVKGFLTMAMCVNCSSGPGCKLFPSSYVSSVSFFFLVLCLQRFSGSVNYLFL